MSKHRDLKPEPLRKKPSKGDLVWSPSHRRYAHVVATHDQSEGILVRFTRSEDTCFIDWQKLEAIHYD